MQVSRYSTPFAWHSSIRLMLETSTETLSRKSPGFRIGSSTARMLPRVSGLTVKVTP